MTYIKKILVMLMVLALCGTIVSCSSPAGNTGGDSTKTEAGSENSKDEEKTEKEPDAEANDTVKTANIGIIAWDTGKAEEYEFVNTVQTTLSEQYSDQIGEVLVMDTREDAAMLPTILENYIAMWEGENAVVLIVNGENGFSDEEILSIMKDAEKAGIITGVDHIIDGAPESTFVYDVSDAAMCASMIIENAPKE